MHAAVRGLHDCYESAHTHPHILLTHKRTAGTIAHNDASLYKLSVT